jgi:signal transduction histidine kinase
MTHTEGLWAKLRIERSILLNVYVVIIGCLGLLLVTWSVVHIPDYPFPLIFALLIVLTAVAAIATTSVPFSDETGITYHIGSAISIAAVPVLGVGAAIVIAAVEDLCTWLIKPADGKTWKRTWRQLIFNTGMHAIAVFTAGFVLLFLRRSFGATTVWGQTLPWLPAAFLYEEVNLWLLIGVLRLQHGPTIKPLAIWREDRWATQIDVALMTVGGGLLAFAVANYGAIGVVVFFLPIALSAYAFRLYVRQMQAHLDSLEQIVSERTKQLAERTSELAEINEQKDAFLSVLTHDMMTPLANVQLCAEIIREDPDLSSENRHLTQLMLHSQKTLHNLVRNILDLAKLRAVGSLPMHKSEIELTQLLTRTVEVMQPEAKEKSITLNLPSFEQPIWMTADPLQIERVFLNLLSNAIKYTPMNGFVSLHVTMEQQVAYITVKDTGYGISPEEIPYLFERFRRIKQLEDRASGTGLGLAITKALVEQHGGKIAVSSQVNQGSSFSVTLPID